MVCSGWLLFVFWGLLACNGLHVGGGSGSPATPQWWSSTSVSDIQGFLPVRLLFSHTWPERLPSLVPQTACWRKTAESSCLELHHHYHQHVHHLPVFLCCFSPSPPPAVPFFLSLSLSLTHPPPPSLCLPAAFASLVATQHPVTGTVIGQLAGRGRGSTSSCDIFTSPVRAQGVRPVSTVRATQCPCESALSQSCRREKSPSKIQRSPLD